MKVCFHFVHIFSQSLHERDYDLHVQGGMHTLVAAALTKEVFDRGEIEKELFDKKWELPPCKLYLFKESADEVKDLVHALGQEDNEDYKLVFT